MTAPRQHPQGPLAGLRVIEFAGIGPGPFACMLLSDMGADVVTVDRPGSRLGDTSQIVQRGRTVVQADLKNPAAREDVLALLERADVLVEGFRPGVMERLGLGPDVVERRNPRLVYARMTGWGQSGPLAQAAGHDINYLAITGALHAIGTTETPVPPLNLVGDYGGGSLYLVVGILAALHEARTLGRGQVVDAAITDGAISLMASFVGRSLRGAFVEQRASNMLDGGAPYYRAYATADGRHVSVGPIEPQFFREFCERVGLPPALRDAQNDTAQWPLLHDALEAIFKTRTLVEWNERLEGSDSCYAPVLPLSEAMHHPHNVAREAFVDVDGVRQPAPAPRFSRTPSAVQGPPATVAASCAEVIDRWPRARGPI
jgi:alpha-methylacyl-CoA racemase